MTVTENSLHAISPGGKCDIQSYADGLYTHECRVASYKPQIDYCCCQFKRKAMCCLYHQTWDRFRCNEKEDVIDTFPWKYKDPYGSNGPSKMSLPLLVALPISAFLLLLCIGASIYYYKKRKNAKRYGKDSENLCSSCSKCYEGQTLYFVLLSLTYQSYFLYILHIKLKKKRSLSLDCSKGNRVTE